MSLVSRASVLVCQRSNKTLSLASHMSLTSTRSFRLCRGFCTNNNTSAGVAVVPGQEAVIKFNETQLKLGGDGKTISVKFNDQSVNYELPEELKGTTLRKPEV